MYNYKCDVCGCYLDPGEGRICDECQEAERRRELKAAKIKYVHQEKEELCELSS